MPEPAATTPLMEQYEGVKARYPGHLVLFRVGDFYETFGDDAKLLSREVEVVLTARAPDGRGDRMPMAGVPHHAVDSYLGRLVRKGFKVAICDQVEDPKAARGLVRREVTRVVTPGTVVEDRILPGPEHNFLASVVLPADGPPAVAAVDITTGEWFHGRAPSVGADGVLEGLVPFGPSEVLLALPSDPSRRREVESTLRREFPRARLEAAPPAAAELPAALASEGIDPLIAEADRRLAAYVGQTQPRLLPYLEVVPFAAGRRRLRVDAKTLRHLEISRPMNPDDPAGPTLLTAWDATVTAPGRRTIGFWLRNPLADARAIGERLDAVEALRDRGAGLLELRQRLRPVADLSRIASRVVGRLVRPPELGALRSSLDAVAAVAATLGTTSAALLGELAGRLDPLPVLRDRLGAALPEELPPSADRGGLFRSGYAPALDRLLADERQGLAALDALERREQEASGIRTLKVGYNQVFGYYLEVTRPNLGRVPSHFTRKQTLSGGERFTTEELAGIEERILSARAALGTAEAAAWEGLLAEIDPWVPALHRLSRAVGELDTLASFALLAQERRLVRPEVDESSALVIRDGRHPVLDRSLGNRFVPNDTDLDAGTDRLLVLTGPNMSGKSTYMRQVGLLVLLAQAGSFVPAQFARVGVADAVFTRMGFTDEIGRGKSSFMVEMSEVAEILRSAGPRSLVLLDEVGRGTSTFDGLAIAWAVLRHLCETVRCRTLLATHYHQLTELVEGLAGARNAHLAVDESGGDIAFLHRLVPGSTDRSYGLHVARLAGLPPALLTEADRLLGRLEADGLPLPAGRRRSGPTRYTQGILLPAAPAGPSALETALLALDPDRMSPIEALAFLAEWRRRLAGGGPPT